MGSSPMRITKQQKEDFIYEVLFFCLYIATCPATLSFTNIILLKAKIIDDFVT